MNYKYNFCIHETGTELNRNHRFHVEDVIQVPGRGYFIVQRIVWIGDCRALLDGKFTNVLL